MLKERPNSWAARCYGLQILTQQPEALQLALSWSSAHNSAYRAGVPARGRAG
jgi:hypothetical protein